MVLICPGDIISCVLCINGGGIQSRGTRWQRLAVNNNANPFSSLRCCYRLSITMIVGTEQISTASTPTTTPEAERIGQNRNAAGTLASLKTLFLVYLNSFLSFLRFSCASLSLTKQNLHPHPSLRAYYITSDKAAQQQQQQQQHQYAIVHCDLVVAKLSFSS